jgi:hypothetical protein
MAGDKPSYEPNGIDISKTGTYKPSNPDIGTKFDPDTFNIKELLEALKD